MIDRAEIVGLLLAGGLSRRMGGGDKCLRPLGGVPILQRIVDRAKPQVSTLILNANGDASRFTGFKLPIVPDVVEGFAGPLAGVLTGLEWAAQHAPKAKWVASFATDAPFFPRNLIAELGREVVQDKADLACARSGGQDHPVFGLWPVRLAGALRRALVDEELRKVDLWTARYRLVHVAFPTAPVDPFYNVNRPQDLAEAESLLKSGAAD
jgi:molybdopterin-guanine dinucleotide biosynthesis protein A